MTKSAKQPDGGGVVYAPANGARAQPKVTLLAGPVVKDPDHPQYRGADAETNNAAEIIAMTEMITTGSRAAGPGDHLEVQSDSMCAILAALGRRPQRKQGIRKSNSKTQGERSIALKSKLRAAYAQARAKLGGGQLIIRKVKGLSGHKWNEVADELVAVGRATNVDNEALPVATAELIDRYTRAMEDIGDCNLECRGLSLVDETGE